MTDYLVCMFTAVSYYWGAMTDCFGFGCHVLYVCKCVSVSVVLTRKEMQWQRSGARFPVLKDRGATKLKYSKTKMIHTAMNPYVRK